MQLTEEHIAEIRKFNRNVEWLKRTRIDAPPPSVLVKTEEAWLSVVDATKYIGRSRCWLQRITVTDPGSVRDTSMMLLKGLDWKRITNRIFYKRSSLENLKKGMEKAGDRYDERIADREVKAD